MKKNKDLIIEVIKMRKDRQDPVQKIATRNKASPLDKWNNFEPFTTHSLTEIFSSNDFDGVKMKFRFVVLTINGRHKTE